MELKLYVLPNGKTPFAEWIKKLKDIKARDIIRTKLNYVRLGNLGNFKALGDGIFEFKINFGPGYRIYFGKIGSELILLLVGGDKRTQERDIKTAKQYWQEYLDYEKKKNHR